MTEATETPELLVSVSELEMARDVRERSGEAGIAEPGNDSKDGNDR